eukprot:CAMPEP_0198550420 /NCGR_PEP_ID=MMETSP1462-20131121/74742_1 /TAXON_ID=1333877 /ORGANISM="Brandtodinium nutriculum, Strain RCC3387" /LENGTH=113 /DNA_ID=CAMNT_0044281031 /DNA_START=113 /DNA_END=450 /DNA_ORIENTATION=-
MGMLLFACMVIVLPTLFNALPTDNEAQVLQVSRIGACITMSAYIFYMVFQLLTHAVTLQLDEERMQDLRSMSGASAVTPLYPRVDSQQSGASEQHPEGDDDGDEEASLDAWVA